MASRRDGYQQQVQGYSAIQAGLALAFVALTVASAAGVDEDHHGIAGGVINMTQPIGGAIGLAIATAVARGKPGDAVAAPAH